jgi:hypothetical protein
MRASLGIVTITVLASLIFAADVRDLGVPAGWSASDYDRHGYDLLNKHDYENALRYFDAAIEPIHTCGRRITIARLPCANRRNGPPHSKM